MVVSLADVWSLAVPGMLHRIVVLNGLKLKGDDDSPLPEESEVDTVMVEEVAGIDWEHDCGGRAGGLRR